MSRIGFEKLTNLKQFTIMIIFRRVKSEEARDRNVSGGYRN